MDHLLQIALSSAAGAVFGGLLNGWWNRRTAKKLPKTQMRAEAYRDFVVYVARLAQPCEVSTSTETELEFCDIKARLLLFGEAKVVKATSTFLTNHRIVATDSARKDFAEVVRQMRASLLTGHRGSVIDNVSDLLAIGPLEHNSGAKSSSVPKP